jgi:sterol desaturase/sphingolipid hydroxylase (fatty acid hydroxylase superfamily)
MAAESTESPRYGREVKTLPQARREFLRRRSPWMILAGIVTLAVVRALVGDVSWRDAVAVAAVLVLYPFGEWAIHVHLLHMRPFRFRGRVIDPPAARAHREHHQEPNDLTILLLEPKEVAQLMLLAVPFELGVGALVVGLAAGAVPFGALVSGALTAYVAIGVYEWTHFLIHTAYRPRSRYYRMVWRNHRLHHFKNERYWHGITNNLSDRILGTNPDQSQVPRSRTARTLDPGPAA